MKLIHWLGWVAAAIAIVLIYRRDLEIAALKALQQTAASPPPVAAPAPSPILAPPPPSAGQDTAQLLARITELETQLTERRAALETAQAETERYRNGLENAVAELNRQGQPRGRPRLEPTPSQPVPSTASNIRVWTPATSHVDGDLVVAGKVHNLGTEATEGTVIVEVYDDTGELVGEERVETAVEPRALGDYYVRLAVPRRELRVAVRWESL